jgi:serine/threonine protein kinase
MEQIVTSPHPNIIGYHGIQVQDGRILGLVFDRYQRNLLAHLKRGDNVEIGGFASALASAVSHLHSLGFAHNDINPENNMVDDNGKPILIDFGSCEKPEQRIFSGGTPGWVYESFTLSNKDHDIFALGKLMVWLQRPELD